MASLELAQGMVILALALVLMIILALVPMAILALVPMAILALVLMIILALVLLVILALVPVHILMLPIPVARRITIALTMLQLRTEEILLVLVMDSTAIPVRSPHPITWQLKAKGFAVGTRHKIKRLPGREGFARHYAVVFVSQ
jgi:hypothetical protein